MAIAVQKLAGTVGDTMSILGELLPTYGALQPLQPAVVS